jgi:hypothetical protein
VSLGKKEKIARLTSVWPLWPLHNFVTLEVASETSGHVAVMPFFFMRWCLLKINDQEWLWLVERTRGRQVGRSVATRCLHLHQSAKPSRQTPALACFPVKRKDEETSLFKLLFFGFFIWILVPALKILSAYFSHSICFFVW